jgi:hypothetical protein
MLSYRDVFPTDRGGTLVSKVRGLKVTPWSCLREKKQNVIDWYFNADFLRRSNIGLVSQDIGMNTLNTLNCL